ncbi:MAG: RlmE family RNA methyltransferase [Methanomicrobiaceae archaeon]|nr:RlmE family RNA methyltransferase [Methanomicrobiaceae archaeon]
MGSQWGKDKYYSKSKSEGYRSRAAYKLLDIQKRFNIIREDDNVIDLGAAPGSWMQVLRDITSGCIVGVDLNPVAPLEDTIMITGDFTSEKIQERIISTIHEVNVIVCDASPKFSGNKTYDQARAIGLNEDAFGFVLKVLKPGGNFVIKSFQGEMFTELLEDIRNSFYSVKVYRTKASRRGSTETYIIAKNFRGNHAASD